MEWFDGIRKKAKFPRLNKRLIWKPKNFWFHIDVRIYPFTWKKISTIYFIE